MRHDLCAVAHVLTHARPCGVPYRNAVLLSIAQGWQVQLSLPWVTDADRGLPTTWVVLSFAHIITHPNETVGAVPACPPERPRSGVSIPKIHASCARNERRMRPCRATRAGTQAPPLPNSVIFFHTIPYKQNDHLHAIHTNETVGAVPACPPECPRSGVSIPKIHALCVGNLTMDAPLWGDTGGHTGTAPTKLRYTFTNRGRKCIAHSRPLNSK